MAFLGLNSLKDSWVYKTSNGVGKNHIIHGQTSAINPKVVGEEVKEFNRPRSAVPEVNKYSIESRTNFNLSGKFSRPTTATSTGRFSPVLRPSSANYTKNLNTNTSDAQILILDQTTGDFQIRSPTRNSSPDLGVKQEVPPKVPRYVETDKKVLRFFCYFVDKDVLITKKPLRKTQPGPTARYFTLLIYLEDFTIEILEDHAENSGIQGGAFYKRAALKNNRGNELLPTDFMVGRSFTALGHEFFITDCDKFTREYYRRELKIILEEGYDRPERVDPGAGAETATGLGVTRPISAKKNNSTCSSDYLARKEQLNKTNKFLSTDRSVLQFRCVEVGEKEVAGLADRILGSGKKYALSYFVVDDAVEVRTIKSQRSSADDPTMLLKKSKLPINWRDTMSNRPLRYYTADDLIVGKVIDCFGRKLLLTGCDEATRRYYASKGVEQKEILVEEPKERSYEIEVPKLGDGFLAIGSEKDTLHTIFGHPKPSKNWKKVQRNRGIVLRCRTKLLDPDQINSTRTFCLTFYLEDDTIGVFEEVKRNSGIVGGNFLKRGIYVNALPPDHPEPRPFVATDIYLGNVISLNGYEMQITEMDDMSVRFCEENCDEFPFFDTFQIIQHIMGKVIGLNLDIRQKIWKNYDKKKLGWLTDEEFVHCLDDLEISQEMNDQEMMTMMRRFQSVHTQHNKSERPHYYYHELCDLFSHAYLLACAGQRTGRESDLGRLLRDLRGRQTQWRRAIRLDGRKDGNFILFAHLLDLLANSGVVISPQNKRLIARSFAADGSTTDAILPRLRKLNDFSLALETGPHRSLQAGSPELNSARSMSITGSEIDNESNIIQRRSAVSKSILRAQSYARTSNMNIEDDDIDASTVVIDYHELCNSIYICDWDK